MSDDTLKLYKEVIYADKVFDVNFKNVSMTLYEEIERLKEQLNDEIQEELKQSEIMVKKQQEIERLNNIIEEVRKYIKDKWEMELKDSMEDFLDHDDLIDRKRLLHILELLDKGSDKE